MQNPNRMKLTEAKQRDEGQLGTKGFSKQKCRKTAAAHHLQMHKRRQSKDEEEYGISRVFATEARGTRSGRGTTSRPSYAQTDNIRNSKEQASTTNNHPAITTQALKA